MKINLIIVLLCLILTNQNGATLLGGLWAAIGSLWIAVTIVGLIKDRGGPWE